MAGCTGHGWVVQRADGYKARCGGPHVCADCALESILAADAGAEPEPEVVTNLFIGLRNQIASLQLERDRYREILGVVANLGDGDVAGNAGVLSLRNYVRRMLRAATADFTGR